MEDRLKRAVEKGEVFDWGRGDLVRGFVIRESPSQDIRKAVERGEEREKEGERGRGELREGEYRVRKRKRVEDD